MPFEQTADWDQHAPQDEARVKRAFGHKVKRLAGKLPFAEDLLTAYYCAFDQATPVQVKTARIVSLAYVVLPFDVVPDMMPLLCFTDDAAILLTALRMVTAHVRPEHREAARRALARGLADTP